MARSSVALAQVEALPSSINDAGDTSLELYRQSQEAEASSSREIWAADGTLAPEIEAAICTDKWAIRHRIVNETTGESFPMQCKRYKCLHCGPRRVAMWRAIIEQAEPERFITLSRVGDTLVEVGRVMTVIARRLRRLGYHFEYLATFERHRVAANGYHIHIIQTGDYIPQAVLSECLRSATHGRSWVVDIRRASGQVAGYVTKYVTKALTHDEIGEKPDGSVARPNRIRYSKRFFKGATTKEIRAYLIGEMWDRRRERGEAIPDEESESGPWRLVEVAELPRERMTGCVDQEQAHQQYRKLVEARALEQGTTFKPSRGGLHVVQFMLAERRRSVAAAEVRRDEREGAYDLSGAEQSPVSVRAGTIGVGGSAAKRASEVQRADVYEVCGMPSMPEAVLCEDEGEHLQAIPDHERDVV